jgi:hypothetical protein
VQVSSHCSSLFFCKAFITVSSSKFIFFFYWAPFFLPSIPAPPNEKVGVGRPIWSIYIGFFSNIPPLESAYMSTEFLNMLISMFFKIIYHVCSDNKEPWAMTMFSRVCIFALLISTLKSVPNSCIFSTKIAQILSTLSCCPSY